jgi:hypothetical protein
MGGTGDEGRYHYGLLRVFIFSSSRLSSLAVVQHNFRSHSEASPISRKFLELIYPHKLYHAISQHAK